MSLLKVKKRNDTIRLLIFGSAYTTSFVYVLITQMREDNKKILLSNYFPVTFGVYQSMAIILNIIVLFYR
jgi:hypothetical protein